MKPSTLLIAPLLLLACGEEEPSEQPAPTMPEVVLEATWRGGVRQVIETKCLPCHTSYGFGDLLIETRGDLVEVPSSIGMPLVAPGDVEGSYLWHKILGTQDEVGGTGERMPLDVAPLTDEEVDLIETWIVEGAILE